MEIRIAKNENDSISASAIYAASWKAAYKNIYSVELLSAIPSDFWVAAFNNNYKTHRFEIAILKNDGEDLGAGGYGLSRDYPEKNYGEITSIYFIEKAWGKGFAQALMNFMMKKLNAMGYPKIHVWVLKDNMRAQVFYEKCGFNKTGNEKEIIIKGENKMEVEYIV